MNVRSREEVLEDELLKSMPVRLHQVTGDGWGPNPIVCRWCFCWLEYGDGSPGKPKEAHEGSCFAALWLNRPRKP